MIQLEKTMSPHPAEQLVHMEYDFYPYQVQNHGKVRLIVCNRGLYALKKTAVGREQMQFFERLHNHLEKQDFTGHLPVIRNKYGDFFVDAEGDYYYVTRWIKEDQERKTEDDYPLHMLKTLGQLHRYTVGLDGPQHPSPLSPEVIAQRWQERLETMRGYKQFAKQRELMSPIEVSFVSCFGVLEDLSQRAVRYLLAWKTKTEPTYTARQTLFHGHIYSQHMLCEQGSIKGTLSPGKRQEQQSHPGQDQLPHSGADQRPYSSSDLRQMRDVNQRNEDLQEKVGFEEKQVKSEQINFEQKKVYVLGLEQAKMDTPVRDLALFFRRHIEPKSEWSLDTAWNWLRTYESELELTPQEKSLFGILILFPERIFKEIELFYNKKRDVHPVTLARHFEQQVEHMRLVLHFTEQLCKESNTL